MWIQRGTRMVSFVGLHSRDSRSAVCISFCLGVSGVSPLRRRWPSHCDPTTPMGIYGKAFKLSAKRAVGGSRLYPNRHACLCVALFCRILVALFCRILVRIKRTYHTYVPGTWYLFFTVHIVCRIVCPSTPSVRADSSS